MEENSLSENRFSLSVVSFRLRYSYIQIYMFVYMSTIHMHIYKHTYVHIFLLMSFGRSPSLFVTHVVLFPTWFSLRICVV